MISTLHQIFRRSIKKNEMWHVWDKGEEQTGCWWGNLRGRDNLENLSTDERIILKWILKK